MTKTTLESALLILLARRNHVSPAVRIQTRALIRKTVKNLRNR